MLARQFAHVIMNKRNQMKHDHLAAE
uniref:Uncharacterized protein n=1 Tax=Arundo donax TaxID=35708 RepID=A0A0A9A2N7_ARUDO